MNTSSPTSVADSGAVLDVRRQREVLHPRADVRGEQAEPDPAGSRGTRTPPGRCPAGGGGGGRRAGTDIDLTGWVKVRRVGADVRVEVGSVPSFTPIATTGTVLRMSSDAGTPKLSMAELTRVAAERYGEATAATFQRDGEWVHLTFDELWDEVRRLSPRADRARGRRRRPGRHRLQHAGRVHHRRPRRVGVRRHRRADLPVELARRVRVGARRLRRRVVICENADQRRPRSTEVRAELPDLEHIVVIDGDGDRVP